MKIAVIYAGASPQLISVIEGELKKALRDEDKPFYISAMTDPSLIADVRESGFVKADSARKLIRMYFDAADRGADIIYSVPLALGEVAYSADALFKRLGIRLVRIDEMLWEAALHQGRKIGLIATQRISIEPAHQLLMKYAKSEGIDIECVDILCEDAFGKTRDETAMRLSEAVDALENKPDVYVLAQESLSLCERELTAAIDAPVLSPARYGAMAVYQAVLAIKNYNTLALDEAVTIDSEEETAAEPASQDEAGKAAAAAVEVEATVVSDEQDKNE